MRRRSAVTGAVMVSLALVGIYSLSRAQDAATQPTQERSLGFGQRGARGAGRGGRGGGIGFNNPYGISGPLPGKAIYAEHCQGCHGADLSGGRAPMLFDEKWQAVTTDDHIRESIRNGIDGTEMGAYSEKLTSEQIDEVIKYIRNQSGALKPPPPFHADPEGTILRTAKHVARIEVVARELDTPWGMVFLPDGRILVTERTINNGTLRIVDKGKVSPPIVGTPKVAVGQDAGMFDVILHPKYAENGWIYLSYAAELPTNPALEPTADAAGFGGRGGRGQRNAPTMTNVVRGRIKDGVWVDQQFIFQSPPELYTNSRAHYGSRFAFDKDGHLFYSIGERAAMENAQNLSTPLGKVHRVNDDGSIPRDNPFVNTPNAVPSIWTYGNRNPQGLSWDPVTGKLWESEHGPTNGDEINILKPGHNYGWGVVTKGSMGGITKTSEPGMDDPVVYYTPTIAPSGINFYPGDKFPKWKNNLFVTGLAGQQLRRLEIADETVTSQEVIFDQFGRVRQVVPGPDGYIYVLLQGTTEQSTPSYVTTPPGMIARLVPAE